MYNEQGQDNASMSPDRLIKAADVLLAARARGGEGGQSEAFVDAWLGGASNSSAVDRPFTYAELVEAMCFLMRCGFVETSATESASTSSGGARKRRIEKK